MKLIKYFLIFLFISFISFIRSEVDLNNLRTVLSRLPDWNEEAEIEPIKGGLTNQNFKLTLPHSTYFVRVGGESIALLGLDPEREYQCTRLAAEMGIAPSVLLYEPAQKVLVTPFIASQPFELNRSACQLIARTLKVFHESGKELPNRFCPYEVIEGYYRHALALRYDHRIPFASLLLPIVEEIKTAMPKFLNLVPCHLDLHSRNCLYDGSKMWIIDWEYGGMADPLFDLASWAAADGFSIEQMQDLLSLYMDNPSPSDLARLYLLSILAHIRWGLWCFIQEEISPVEFSYADFGDRCLSQAFAKTCNPLYQASLRLLIGEQAIKQAPILKHAWQ